MSTLAPVRKRIRVPGGVEDAFELYTSGIDAWWPKATHSVGRERTARVVLEGRAGGSIHEISLDGSTCAWGTILVWEPPFRIVHTWHPGRAETTAQEVELRFRAMGPDTEVVLEHRGWETLGEEAEATRASYDQGWDRVFGIEYGRAAERRQRVT